MDVDAVYGGEKNNLAAQVDRSHRRSKKTRKRDVKMGTVEALFVGCKDLNGDRTWWDEVGAGSIEDGDEEWPVPLTFVVVKWTPSFILKLVIRAPVVGKIYHST